MVGTSLGGGGGGDGSSSGGARARAAVGAAGAGVSMRAAMTGSSSSAASVSAAAAAAVAANAPAVTVAEVAPLIDQLPDPSASALVASQVLARVCKQLQQAAAAAGVIRAGASSTDDASLVTGRVIGCVSGGGGRSALGPVSSGLGGLRLHESSVSGWRQLDAVGGQVQGELLSKQLQPFIEAAAAAMHKVRGRRRIGCKGGLQGWRRRKFLQSWLQRGVRSGFAELAARWLRGWLQGQWRQATKLGA